MLLNPLTIEAINDGTYSGGAITYSGTGDLQQWQSHIRLAGSLKNINGIQQASPDFQISVYGQNPPVFVQEDERPYFTTGSNTTAVLTASIDIASNHLANNFQVMPTAIVTGKLVEFH